MRRLRIHRRCRIVLATLLVVSAARAGRADDAGAAEYGMGMWLVGKGRMVEAEAALRRGLAIDAAGARGSSAARVRARAVSTLDVLASLAAGRGDSREAEARASHARKLYERMKGPEHVELAEALTTLAAVRASRGDLDGAEALLLRARRVAELGELKAKVGWRGRDAHFTRRFKTTVGVTPRWSAELDRIVTGLRLLRAAPVAARSPENRHSDPFQLRPVEREAERALDLVDTPRLEGADT